MAKFLFGRRLRHCKNCDIIGHYIFCIDCIRAILMGAVVMSIAGFFWTLFVRWMGWR